MLDLDLHGAGVLRAAQCQIGTTRRQAGDCFEEFICYRRDQIFGPFAGRELIRDILSDIVCQHVAALPAILDILDLYQ